MIRLWSWDKPGPHDGEVRLHGSMPSGRSVTILVRRPLAAAIVTLIGTFGWVEVEPGEFPELPVRAGR